MKTAISVRDDDFERFERLATEHGMNRSEFFRRAGLRFADALEDVSGLTRIAEEVLTAAAGDDAQARDVEGWPAGGMAVTIRRGDIVRVVVGEARGAESEQVLHAVVMQADWLLDTSISTVLVVPFTSNLTLSGVPGNVAIPAAAAATLECDVVADVSRFGPVPRERIGRYPVGYLPAFLLTQVAAGIRLSAGI